MSRVQHSAARRTPAGCGSTPAHYARSLQRIWWKCSRFGRARQSDLRLRVAALARRGYKQYPATGTVSGMGVRRAVYI